VLFSKSAQYLPWEHRTNRMCLPICPGIPELSSQLSLRLCPPWSFSFFLSLSI
jgi:hypothetical protein